MGPKPIPSGIGLREEPREPPQSLPILSGWHHEDLGDQKACPILLPCHSRPGWSQKTQDGRRIGELGGCKVYPILWPGHSGTGSQGCPKRLWRRTQLSRKSTPSCPPDLRKPPSSLRQRGGPLCEPKLCLPQRLTAPGAPSCTGAATSCPEKFPVKLPHSYWILGALQTC